jgi:hypothetical protein
MNNFQTAVNNVVNEMVETSNSDTCVGVYWDDNYPGDNAVLMFHEHSNYANMHEVMQYIHDKLSDKLGYPVSICHNHPTDESVLILGNASDSRVYYSAECCKNSTIESCLNFIKTHKGYSPNVQSIAKAAECLAENLNKTPEYILNMLDWNKDPQAQMIQLLIDFHD